MRRFPIVFFLLSIVLFNLNCSKEAEIIGEEKDKILEYAEPMVDSILKGYNEANFELYSKDFDEAMRKAITESVFHNTRSFISSKIGFYVSKSSSRIYRKEKFIAVIYEADFEKEKGVTVRVVFQKYGEKNMVTGLWFNSPKLRGQ